MLLYVGWQLWIGDVIYGAERSAQAQEQSEQWQQQYEEQAAASPSATPATPGTPAPAPADTTADPVILPEPADAEIFGIMHIPRFGPDYQVNIAGGITRPRTLDPIGIGHYPGTQMP